MSEKNHGELMDSLNEIKNLLILLLDKFEVKRDKIAEVMGVSEASLSKMLKPKKYKRQGKK